MGVQCHPRSEDPGGRVSVAEPLGVLEGYQITEHGWWVTLDDVEREWSKRVARKRDRKAIAAKAEPNPHAREGLGMQREPKHLTSVQRNAVGCYGECAVAKRLDVEWSGADEGWAEDRDVSGIQVRATSLQNGCLRGWAKDGSQPLILAVIYQHGVVRLAGWRRADDMPRRGNECGYATQRELWPMEKYVVPDGLPRYQGPDGGSL